MAINARAAVAKSGKKATIKNPVPAALGVTNTVLTHPVKPAKPKKSRKVKPNAYASNITHQKKTKLIKGGGTMTLY